MVIVKIMGGLGNQLFQYAAGRRLSYINNVPLKLDLTWFETQNLRSFQLQLFHTQQITANIKELLEIKAAKARKRIRYLLRLGHPFRKNTWNIISEESLRPLNTRVITAEGFVYLQGYWQTEKYFKDIEGIIRSECMLKTIPDNDNVAMARKLEDTNAVSMHVRRGDYVSNPNTYQYHGTCTQEYYQIAIHYMSQHITNPHFFVFSDDTQWCRDNLVFDFPVTFVVHNTPEKGYEDLRLMSKCKHHIIANSSFSWWGAWLNTNPNKIVCAPQKWFNSPRTDASDLIPINWVRL